MSGTITARVTSVGTGLSTISGRGLKRLALGGLILALSACSQGTETSSGSAAPDLSTLQTRIEALSEAVDKQEGVRAVKRLQWAYGHYSELGLWDDFADLFAADAVGHYTTGALNRDQIRDLFVNQVGQGKLGLAAGRIYPHISFSPVVNVEPDGQSIKARFRIVAMLGGYGTGATWFHGLYNNRYAKEDGIWKFNEVTFQGQIVGGYDKGLSPTVSGPLDQPTAPFYYDPDMAGEPILVNADKPATATPDKPADFATLASTFGALKHRIAVLNAEAAVSNLQHAYGYYIDRKLWDDVTDLFADNGTLELGQSGVYAGKASIRKAFGQFGGPGLADGDMNDHMEFQTYVSISPDGHTAKARGVHLAATGHDGTDAKWHEGIYENEYVQEDGVWKIRSVHFYPRLITAYDKGWAEDAEATPGPSQDVPPDAPPTEIYENYPTFYIAPFHFRHPVTGRVPHYPEGSPAAEASIGFADSIALGDETVAGSPEELAAEVTAAEQALQRAEAYDGAENVLNAYSFYLDEHMWTDAAALFAANGSNDIPGVGRYAGRDRIGQALDMAYGPGGRQEGALDVHQLIQPVIDVAEDGQSAKIRVRLWQVHAQAEGEAYYVAGIYEGQAIRLGGIWKIASLSLNYTWAAPYTGGWASVKGGEALGYAAPADMATTFPPDGPATGPASAPFPKIERMPFHYDNPVSGRPPAVLVR